AWSSPPMSVRVRVYGFLAIVAALVASWYLVNQYYFGDDLARANSKQPANKEKKADDETVPVELATAKQGPISSYLTSTANLRPLRDVVLATQSDGLVKRVLVEEGDFVDKEQMLCLLDDSEFLIKLKLTEQKLAQARLQLEKARIREQKAEVQITNTQAELKRKQKAFAEKLVSEEEVATLRYRLDELEHDERVAASEVREFIHRVEELEAEIEQVKLELSRTRIVAPFSGYITERTVELGQTVRNLDSLFRLGAFSPLYADVHLSELDAHRVRPGQTAMLSLGSEGSVSIQGRVLRISPIVDDSTGTVKVTVELAPSKDAFKPGSFVRVDIETDSRLNVVLIPKRALLEEDGENFIFVAKGDSARRRKVTLGYETAREVEVREGVSVGESIVVAGQGNLKEGAKIREVES
ncbi:efflux RND transporter periplasmic adaptor subunit, partial [Acidobacteria bacterium AH-259-A15]|nr:efflux RND transporter periplasmic adaptor subunit [Acidobacteria bacterium AH-259-A15]